MGYRAYWPLTLSLGAALLLLGPLAALLPASPLYPRSTEPEPNSSLLPVFQLGSGAGMVPPERVTPPALRGAGSPSVPSPQPAAKQAGTFHRAKHKVVGLSPNSTPQPAPYPVSYTHLTLPTKA